MMAMEASPADAASAASPAAPSIAVETPLQDDVRALISALNDYLLPLSPIEFQFKMTVAEMAAADTTVFIARDAAGVAIGCGALKAHSPAFGEVKRMYTRPDRQGQGIGTAILNAIETQARQMGLAKLMLETGEGPGFDAACRLYESRGFIRRGAYLDYPDSGWSRFYEKPV